MNRQTMFLPAEVVTEFLCQIDTISLEQAEEIAGSRFTSLDELIRVVRDYTPSRQRKAYDRLVAIIRQDNYFAKYL